MDGSEDKVGTYNSFGHDNNNNYSFTINSTDNAGVWTDTGSGSVTFDMTNQSKYTGTGHDRFYVDDIPMYGDTAESGYSGGGQSGTKFYEYAYGSWLDAPGGTGSIYGGSGDHLHYVECLRPFTVSPVSGDGTANFVLSQNATAAGDIYSPMDGGTGGGASGGLADQGNQIGEKPHDVDESSSYNEKVAFSQPGGCCMPMSGGMSYHFGGTSDNMFYTGKGSRSVSGDVSVDTPIITLEDPACDYEPVQDTLKVQVGGYRTTHVSYDDQLLVTNGAWSHTFKGRSEKTKKFDQYWLNETGSGAETYKYSGFQHEQVSQESTQFGGFELTDCFGMGSSRERGSQTAPLQGFAWSSLADERWSVRKGSGLNTVVDTYSGTGGTTGPYSGSDGPQELTGIGFHRHAETPTDCWYPVETRWPEVPGVTPPAKPKRHFRKVPSGAFSGDSAGGDGMLGPVGSFLGTLYAGFAGAGKTLTHILGVRCIGSDEFWNSRDRALSQFETRCGIGNDLNGKVLHGSSVAMAIGITAGMSLPNAQGGSNAIVRSMGNDCRPMQIIREIKNGEKIADILSEGKGLTFAKDLEHAVVKLRDGRRVLVAGGKDGIILGEDVTRVFGHTHPYGRPFAGPSGDDFKKAGTSRPKTLVCI